MLFYHVIVKADYWKGRRNGVYFAVINSDYLALNDLMVVNNELERIWKGTVMA
jgi:hypothetical protein